MLGITTFLLENSIEISATETAFYDFIIQISTGEISYDQILDWLKKNSSS
jgi:prophage maintenance system killer protein